MNPSGLCKCGCGEKTPLAKRTYGKWGHVKGQPIDFIHNHHRNGIKHTEESRAKMSEKIQAHVDVYGGMFAGKSHSDETKKRMREAQLGEKSANFKGGKKLDSIGYMTVWVGHDHPMANVKGYVREHRLVMSEHLGRELLPDEDVHHINGDHLDNRVENLEVKTHAIHTKDRNEAIYADAVELNLRNGLTVEEIAEKLHLKPSTVRRYASAEASTITL